MHTNQKDEILEEPSTASLEGISKRKLASPYNQGNDTAPRIDDWTGRVAELRALAMDHRACFVTGIGGQGKSALASKFLSLSDSKIYAFRDWRDFKEEDLNFQYKLFNLIELVSHQSESTDNLVGLDTTELIEIFFRYLGDQKGLFVFDNIDKYIDLEKFVPAGDMMIFFEKVMRLPHNSKFIFTCRPFIQYAGIGSYQIKLEGLYIEDTIFLLKKYHGQLNDTRLTEYSTRLHQATRGHPLWISLAIAQSRDNSQQLETIIQKIENRNISDTDINYSSAVSRTVLENLWSNLKDREKIILRTLSVSAITESEEALANVLKSKLNYNQFSKSMRSLKLLNLVVSKENLGYVELHPLVREFIISNYGKDEQEGYIALYVKYLNGFILLLKEKLGKTMNPEDIEIIIKKVEITTISNNLQESINELRRSWGSMVISGFSEEALRISDALLSRLTWNKRKLSDLIGFFEFIDIFFEKCSEFGRRDLFEKYINKYNSVYQTPDMSMILSKSSSCRHAWFDGNYELAIKEGKSASDLIDQLQEDELWRGKWHYNLALRDSRVKENILSSLNFFLNGRSIDDILMEKSDNINASQIGNAARCLIYINDFENGKKMLCKAYRELKTGHTNSYTLKQNLGYASEWIAEYLLSTGNNKGHLYFLINSKNLWHDNLPERSNKINQLISKIPASAENSSILSLESWQISKYCDEMVERNLI
ncbi:hypothetical protein CTI10_012745 [Delftia acidovorans]|uniref:Uncharacterized protein n=1 Tax=Chryseobacterium sp. B5 TaxID=2050562 RepID=A0A2G7T6Y9_9FLAO|nr:hypothetical protein CTI10_012745 [Delftia acidovorans]